MEKPRLNPLIKLIEEDGNQFRPFLKFFLVLPNQVLVVNINHSPLLIPVLKEYAREIGRPPDNKFFFRCIQKLLQKVLPDEPRFYSYSQLLLIDCC